MDERYLAGKIYQISCDETDDLYIGSTIQTLERRMSEHKSYYKAYVKGTRCKKSSCELLQYSTARIKLLFNYPCNNRAELEREEGEIQSKTANCINRKIAGRTKKKYYQDNKEKKNEYNKQYQQDNRERINEQKRLRYAKKIADN